MHDSIRLTAVLRLKIKPTACFLHQVLDDTPSDSAGTGISVQNVHPEHHQHLHGPDLPHRRRGGTFHQFLFFAIRFLWIIVVTSTLTAYLTVRNLSTPR